MVDKMRKWLFFHQEFANYTLITCLLSSIINATDNGGWDIAGSDAIETGTCNIPIEDSHILTQEIFLQKYAYSQPVIIKFHKGYNKKFRKMCERENMLSKFGDKIIRLSSANTHSYEKTDVSLRTYVTDILRPQNVDTLGNETLYWFGDNNHTEWESLFREYFKPKYRLPGLEPMLSFGLAGAGTGVPFHWHGPGFGEVIYGRKRWFLYPPDSQPVFHPNATTLQWTIKNYPELHPDKTPLECTIGPGHVIYFPNKWWHGTLNIDTSVFISTFLG